MKQKMVIEMPMKNAKSRTKAMKIAFSFNGVEKADLDVPGKDQIEVVGVDVDSVDLVASLRKQFGSAKLLSVSVVQEKKPEPLKPPPKNPYEDVGAWANQHYFFHGFH